MPAIGDPPGTVQLDRERLRKAGLGVYFRPHQIDELSITYDQLRRLVSTGAVEPRGPRSVPARRRGAD